MKKLIIFTQIGGIKNVLGFRTDVVLTGFFQPIIENDFLVYDEKKILSKTTSINAGSIFLIKDSICKEDYERFIGNENSDKIFVLKHQKPTFELQNVTEIYIGRHEPNPRGLYYPEVFEILQDNNEENKLDKIIDTILKSNPKLEAALDFLHDCLVGVPKLPKQIVANYGMHMYVGYDGTDCNGSIEELYNTWKNSPSDYTKLSELRNALLKWAEDK